MHILRILLVKLAYIDSPKKKFRSLRSPFFFARFARETVREFHHYDLGTLRTGCTVPSYISS